MEFDYSLSEILSDMINLDARNIRTRQNSILDSNIGAFDKILEIEIDRRDNIIMMR